MDCLPVYLPTNLITHPPTYLPIHPPTYLPIYTYLNLHNKANDSLNFMKPQGLLPSSQEHETCDSSEPD